MKFAILSAMIYRLVSADRVGDKVAEVSCTLWQKLFQTDQCGRMQEAVSHLSWLQVCDIFILIALLARLPLCVRCFYSAQFGCGRLTRTDNNFQQGLHTIATIICAAGVYFVNTRHLPWTQISSIVNDNVAWVGVVLAAFTFLSQIWVQYSLGCACSRAQKNHKLVVYGAYKYARNPMFLNFLLHPLVVLLISQNWLLTLSYMPAVLYWMDRIKREERAMITLFGQDYLDYMMRVPSMGALQWLNQRCGLTHTEAQKALKEVKEAARGEDIDKKGE